MKILILYSGGLDSLILKRFAEINYPTASVELVWFDIGQPYNFKERACLPPTVKIHVVDWLDVTDMKTASKNTPSGDIYIPGRNLALATLAACMYLPDEIWMGALLGEIHDGATDKNWEFTELASNSLSYVLSPFLAAPERKVSIRFPLAEAGFNKLTATKWALENGVTAEEITGSSSCLSGTEGNCGHCVVCFRRWGIFKQLGLHEEYEVDPLSVVENQAIINEMRNGNYYDEHRKAEILPALGH